MALKSKSAAKYVRGISMVRFIPHNGHGTYPGATTALGGVFGGAGPFDFTVAHSVISAVPIKFKVDNAAEISKTLNLSAFTETAITVANLVSAITTAAPSGITASADTTTGRLKIVAASGVYLQVYAQAAELAGFGRGIGASFIKSDTLESITVTPKVKDDEEDVTTGADGVDVKVIIEGYFQGATGSISDTAEDYEMMRLFSGGSIDAAGAYSAPNSASLKPYFGIEIFNPYYGKGESKQGEMLGYEKITVYNAMGSLGDDGRSKSFSKKPYTFNASTYKTAAGVEVTAVKYEYLTLAAYAALDIDNV